MAAYIKTLKDSTQTDIIYPQTKAAAVFFDDGTSLQNKTFGGNVTYLSSIQPESANSGDMWYQIL